METMLPGDYVDINRAGVIAEVKEFSKKGFSGEVRYRVDLRGKHGVDFGVYHVDTAIVADSNTIVAEREHAIDMWLSLPGTVIVFQFNRGKIHKVESRAPRGRVD